MTATTPALTVPPSPRPPRSVALARPGPRPGWLPGRSAGDDARRPGAGVAADATPVRRTPPRRRPPGRWRVLLWRARLPVAATMLGLATALALADLRPDPPPRTAVVVTAHAVDAGSVLEDGDLAVVHVPRGTPADGAHTDPAAVTGRVVAVALPAGLPVVDALLRDDRLAAAGPPGTVVAPVRLADPGVAELLRPGDRVDLFAAATSGTGEPVSRLLARRALVLPHPGGAAEPPDTGLLGPAEAERGTLTLVAVRPDEAATLAGATAWAGISAVVVE